MKVLSLILTLGLVGCVTVPGTTKVALVEGQCYMRTDGELFRVDVVHTDLAIELTSDTGEKMKTLVHPTVRDKLILDRDCKTFNLISTEGRK